jgi:hypothetical protein
MSKSIIHHAVEEEARLMRVIMHKARDESSESIKIIPTINSKWQKKEIAAA